MLSAFSLRLRRFNLGDAGRAESRLCPFVLESGDDASLFLSLRLL